MQYFYHKYFLSLSMLIIGSLFYLLPSMNVVASEATVKSEFLEVFTAAGRGYPIFFVVENGEKFQLLKRKTDWIKIKSKQGQVGWISYQDYASSVYLARPNIRKLAVSSRWELGVSTGKFGSDNSFSASAGYYIKPTVAVQAEYKKVIGEFSHSNMLSGKFMFQMMRDRVVSPFISLGLGVMENTPRQSLVNADVEQENLFLGGGGFNYIPYKRLNMRFTVNNYYLNKSKRNYIDYRLGIFALFG